MTPRTRHAKFDFFPAGVAFALIALAAASCSAPTRTIVLRLTDSELRPIEGAHIRAIPLNSGPVPLPVSLERLEEFEFAREQTATTDASGAARVAMYSRLPHLVEVMPPPLGETAEEGPWRFTLDAARTGFTRSEAVDPSGSSVHLELIK